MNRQPEPDSDGGSRQRILDAASAEFAALGFAGARVDAIADRAGVNKAMLYYHVGDKQALYTAVLLRNFDRVSRGLQLTLAGGGSPRERLVRVIAGLSAMVSELPDHPRIVLREVASGAVHLPDDVLARMLEVVGIVQELLAEGVAAGELRRTEPLLTHLAIVGAVVFLNAIAPLRERAAALAPAGALPAATTDIGAFLADLLLGGLAAQSPTGEPS
jgi:AcrR family transcriptional regulator